MYAFGGTADGLEVVEQQRGQSLAIRRTGGSARALFHQGEHRFHPAGAPTVSVQFVMGETTAREVIIGPAPTVRAVRIGG